MLFTNLALWRANPGLSVAGGLLLNALAGYRWSRAPADDTHNTIHKPTSQISSHPLTLLNLPVIVLEDPRNKVVKFIFTLLKFSQYKEYCCLYNCAALKENINSKISKSFSLGAWICEVYSLWLYIWLKEAILARKICQNSWCKENYIEK